MFYFKELFLLVSNTVTAYAHRILKVRTLSQELFSMSPLKDKNELECSVCICNSTVKLVGEAIILTLRTLKKITH